MDSPHDGRARLHVQRSRLISNPVLFSAGDVCEALYCEADVSSSAWTRYTMAARVRLHVQRSRLISNPVLFSAGDVCEALYCEADVSSSAWTRHTMAARVFMCSVAVSSLTQCSSMESQMVQNSPGFHRRVIIKTAFS